MLPKHLNIKKLFIQAKVYFNDYSKKGKKQGKIDKNELILKKTKNFCYKLLFIVCVLDILQNLIFKNFSKLTKLNLKYQRAGNYLPFLKDVYVLKRYKIME
jgi:hypothetical protein